MLLKTILGGSALCDKKKKKYPVHTLCFSIDNKTIEYPIKKNGLALIIKNKVSDKKSFTAKNL